MSTKTIAKILGIVVVTVFVVAGAVAPAQAATVAELQAMIAQLQAQIAQLAGGSVAATFTSNLTVGSTGAEVSALQNFLASKGFLSATARGYFGSLTKAALAAYQAANGISPAAGYFGPITRAQVNAAAGSSVSTGGTVTTTGGTVSTPGVEGTLTVTLAPTPSSGTTIYEGDQRVGVLGLKIEAKLSDVKVERVKVNLGTDTNIYTKEFSRIYVMDGSTVVASSDLNSTTVVKEGSNYYITLTGINVVAPKDGTKYLTIAVDAFPSIKNSGSLTATFSLPTNGVRGTDGAGINQYAGDNTVTRTVNVNAILTDSAKLTVSTSPSTPDATMVIANDGSANDEKDKVVVLKFDARAEKDAVTVTDLVVTVAKTGTGAATATTAYLMDGSSVIASATINATTGVATFTDTNQLFVVPRDTTKTYTIAVDIRSANSTAATEVATLSTASGFSAENSQGSTVSGAYLSGSATGNSVVVLDKGPQFTLLGKSIVKGVTASQNNTSTSTLTATFNLQITAVGGDVYIGNQTASTTFLFDSYQSGAVAALSNASSTSWDIPSSGVVSMNSGTSFKLQQNNSVTIPITVTTEGRTTAGVLVGTTPTSIGLRSIKWNLDNGATAVTTNYMTGLTGWRTDYSSY